MPGIMFHDVVCPRGRSNRKWSTVPLSFALHTVVLAVLIVMPLIATDIVPSPRTTLHFDIPYVPAVPSAPPARRAAAPRAVPGTTGAPVVAPDTIGAESGVIFQPGDVDTSGIDSIAGGIDVGQVAADALPPAAAPPSAPVRTGGTIKPPTRIKYVVPDYPPIAKANKVEGVVIIEAVIGTDGRVENAKVLRGTPLLDGAALEAVRSWQYTPTLLNGAPTAVIMTVTVQFHLN